MPGMIDGITYVPLSDIGMEREENQDYQGHDVTPHGLVFIVADGMGGHAGGATASQMTVNHMKRSLREADIGAAAPALDYCVRAANRAIYETAQHRPDLRGMGSTVVALLMAGDVAWLAHVGDSRIYMLRGNQFMCMTKDHTMVQRMVDDGFLTEDDAENHPSSHVLSRSLGGRDVVEVEMAGAPLQLEVGDIFLLCSDGLTGLVRDGEIARTLLQYELHTAARVLVDEANARGGYDNSTIALVRVDALPVFSHDAYDPPPAREIVPPPPPVVAASAEPIDAALAVVAALDDAKLPEDPDETWRGDGLPAVPATDEAVDADVDGETSADDEDSDAGDDADARDADSDDAEAREADSDTDASGADADASGHESATEDHEAGAPADDDQDDSDDDVVAREEDPGDEDEDNSGDLPDSPENAPTEEWAAPAMSADGGLHGLEDSLSASMSLPKAAEPEPAGLAAAAPLAVGADDEDSSDAQAAEHQPPRDDAAPQSGALDLLPAVDADEWALPEDFSTPAGTPENGDELAPTEGDSSQPEFGDVDPDTTADVVGPADSTADTTVELGPTRGMMRPAASPLELAHRVIEVDDDGPRLTLNTRRIPPRTLSPIEAPTAPQAGVQHTALLIVGVVAVTIGLLVGVVVGRAPLGDLEGLVNASKANEMNLNRQIGELRDVQLPAMAAVRDKEAQRASGLQKDLELTNSELERKEAEVQKLLLRIKSLESDVEKLRAPPEEPDAP